MEKSSKVRVEAGPTEQLVIGRICPNCGFASLVEESREAFCPICAYGKQRCT